MDPSTFPRPLDPTCANAPPPYDVRSCSQEFLRPTFNAIPNSETLRKRLGVPLGIIVQPMSERAEKVPVVDPKDGGIVRCRKCRTYINPFVTWHDNGRRFKCNVCLT